MFQYLIDKIDQAPIKKYPHDHIIINNFLNKEHYETLKNAFEECDWNDIKSKWKMHSNGEYNHCYRSKTPGEDRTSSSLIKSNPWPAHIWAFVKSSEWYNTIAEKLQADNRADDVKFNSAFYWDQPEHFINVHTDTYGHTGSILQFSLFCPDLDYPEYSTALHSDEDGSDTVEYPMKRNTFMLYGVDATTAWHSTRPGDRIRKSWLVRYRPLDHIS